MINTTTHDEIINNQRKEMMSKIPNQSVAFKMFIKSLEKPDFLEDMLLKIEHTYIPNSQVKEIKKDYDTAIKNLKDNKLRIVSYNHTEPGFVYNEDIPNSIPFSTMLIIPDTPVSMYAGDNTFYLLRYLFLQELTPFLYFLCYEIDYYQNGILLKKPVQIKHRLALEDINNVGPNSLRYIIPKGIPDAIYQIINNAPTIIITELNKAPHSAKRDTCHHLTTSYSGKIQYKNSFGKKVGKTIYSEDILYIGKQKDAKSTNFNPSKITHKVRTACEVMGHWRTLPERCKIGHDHDGNEIQNVTWVKSFIRGEGDIVIKNRHIGREGDLNG